MHKINKNEQNRLCRQTISQIQYNHYIIQKGACNYCMHALLEHIIDKVAISNNGWQFIEQYKW